jgi:hypothetical protein
LESTCISQVLVEFQFSNNIKLREVPPMIIY